MAAELAEGSGFSLLCGRYEAIDARVRNHLVDGEVSLGDFVLAGGEVAALAIIEATARLERALFTQDKMAVLLEYAEMLGPMGDAGMMMDFDRASVVSLHRWSLAQQIAQADNIVVLITETLSELNSKIVSNPRVATGMVPMPWPIAASKN